MYGIYIAVVGAIITLTMNFTLIPIENEFYGGYMGSAWATLCCYFTMVVFAYFLGNKHYPIPYYLNRTVGYLLLAVGLFFVSKLIGSNDFQPLFKYPLHVLMVVVYMFVIYKLEVPKSVNIVASIKQLVQKNGSKNN